MGAARNERSASGLALGAASDCGYKHGGQDCGVSSPSASSRCLHRTASFQPQPAAAEPVSAPASQLEPAAAAKLVATASSQPKLAAASI